MLTPILTPVLALICWTLVLWVWLYVTRIPAMRASGGDMNSPEGAKAILEGLPRKVTQIADNYNHLHEQPVIFYAMIFYIHLAGGVSDTDLMLAWAYVGLRVLHSLIQCTSNIIPLRFGVFALASLCLFGIAGRAVINL